MSAELIAQFTPENFSEWCRERFDRFSSDLHPAADPGGYARADVVGYVQSLPEAEINRPLLVMAVNAGKEINERSSRRRQFDFARRQLQAALDRPPAKVKGLFTQGLFAFYDDAGHFRLSLVTGRAEGRSLVYGDCRRQSFFVAPDRENKTFRARMAAPFSTWKRLVEAFSVETLTKEFYNNLFAWYERAMNPASKVSFPNDVERKDDDRSQLAEHLIRLITRLMFVWFIKQKKLVPPLLFDKAELKGLLKDFDPHSPEDGKYYRAILQNLFFATLNCEIDERAFAIEKGALANREHFGIKTLYRYAKDFACTEEEVIEIFKQVPFLNGGLFECLDKGKDYQDGFSRNSKCVAHIPNNLFFDDAGLITLFARYDFTVDENSPNDADVALDPELLGKVFENLLGAYNPETKQTARKQSGSFYTPREIVNYMVDESLKAHLLTMMEKEGQANVGQAFLPADAQTGMSAPLSSSAPLSERIAALLGPDEQDVPFTDTERRNLVEAIYRCRILDPACGSGAFPMGVLLKMVRLLQRLDEKNALWREIVLAEADKALAEAENLDADEKAARRRRITESFDQSVNDPDYARKLYLIENCIFGVDIQSIAVQISKLRAFITLVCDQRPTADPARNYGMLPLPNLETKFVAANTLIGLEADFADGLKTADGASLLNDPELHRLRAELATVRHRHFRARNAREKNKCRAQDEKLRDQIKTRLVKIASQPDAHKIALWQAEIGKLRQQRRAVEPEDWQEVVQTTPTQISFFETAPEPVQTTLRVDVNQEKRDRIDDTIRRLAGDIENEQNRARNKSAFLHEADRLAAWDPYDQNASSPFFDPEWMFDVKDGFDIVIGNPPYVQIQKLPAKEKDAYAAAEYGAFSKSADLYCLFLERGGTLLSGSGTLCYITSNKFFRSGYGKPLRQLLTSEYSLHRLIDFGELPVFEAGTDPVIIQFGREARAGFLAATIKNADDIQNVSQAVTVLGRTMGPDELSQDGWSLSGREAAGILEKMRLNSTPLGEYVKGEIYYGIKTGLNEAFVLDDATRKVLIAADPKSQEIIKPLAKGDDVRKWHIRNKGRWIILTKIGVDIKRYPAVFAHLKKWEHDLKAREDQGNHWWELRACAYYDVFVQPKIVYPEIARESRFALDFSGIHPLKTVFSIASSECFLLGVLNSKAAWHFLKNTCSSLGDPEKGGRLLMQAIYLETLPIPAATPEDQLVVANLVNRILAAKEAYPAADTSAMEREIDEIVYRLYGLTPDEIAIVEGREPGAKKAAAKKAGQECLPARDSQTGMSAPPSGRKPRKSVLTEDPDLA